jgi:hypothetical protein
LPAEQQIGVHVFDKPADYNPGDDNVVRSYARTLRKRLDEYFLKEGLEEPLIITVPRGGYVPVFVERLAPSSESGHSEVNSAPLRPQPVLSGEGHPSESGIAARQRNQHNFVLWIPLLFLVAVISSVFAYRQGRQKSSSYAPPAVHQFWQQFAGGRDTVLVPSDTGLTIILGLTKGSVSVPEYVTGAYVSQDSERRLLPDGWANTNVHRYTDLIDLRVVSSISHLAELPSERTTIRYRGEHRLSIS